MRNYIIKRLLLIPLTLFIGVYYLNGKKYYFSKVNYKKLTGWKRVDDKVWYFGTDGVLRRLSGIRKTSDGLSYYFDPTTGEMTTGWIHYGVNDYYFSPKTGRMLTGWQTIDKKKYYFSKDGAMQTGWQLVGGNWFYMEGSGAMATGWRQTAPGQWYYLNANGAMAASTVIDGYTLDASGLWVS